MQRFIALALLLLTTSPTLAQTGMWMVARPNGGSGGHALTADFAEEAGHALTADVALTATTASSATTAAALAADPPACVAGQFARDIAADGVLTCASPPAATGDVVGPPSSTDNGIARWDGSTGKLLQNGAATITDAGGIETAVVAGAGNIAVRARNTYNDGSKPLSVWNSGVGEVLHIDAIGSMYLKSSFSLLNDLAGGGLYLYPGTSGGAPSYFAANATGRFRWSSTTQATGASDTSLSRAAAGVVQIQNVIQLTPLAAAPACDSSAAGRLYHDTAPALCWCDGSAWQVLAGAGPCS